MKAVLLISILVLLCRSYAMGDSPPEHLRPHPVPGTPEAELASNFGFSGGATPPPGTLAGPQPPQVPPKSPAPGSSEAQLATNFGFTDGATSPPGTLAGPQPPKTS